MKPDRNTSMHVKRSTTNYNSTPYKTMSF
jgi:hypothetical protein